MTLMASGERKLDYRLTGDEASCREQSSTWSQQGEPECGHLVAENGISVIDILNGRVDLQNLPRMPCFVIRLFLSSTFTGAIHILVIFFIVTFLTGDEFVSHCL